MKTLINEFEILRVLIMLFIVLLVLSFFTACSPRVNLTHKDINRLENSTVIKTNKTKAKFESIKWFIQFSAKATKAGYTRSREKTDQLNKDNIYPISYYQTDTINAPVLVFIHGGKYKIGNKDQYDFIGRNLSKKGIHVVIVDFPQGWDCNIGKSILFIHESINTIKPTLIRNKANINNINLLGHSSGGHIASLLALKDTSIRHCYLLDPFGLNLSEYLKIGTYNDEWLYRIFGTEESYWDDCTTSYYDVFDKYTIFLGGKTFTKMYYSTKSMKNSKKYIIENRNHLDMVFQLQDKKNIVYQLLIEDMLNNNKKK